MTTSENPKELFIRAKGRLKRGDLEGATTDFELAHLLDPENPAYMSYYGVCAAMHREKIGLGMELCTKAIKKEFFKAEYYVNLARVYALSGNKKGAISVLQKGLRVAPDDDAINDMLVELGARKKPLIPFLKRSNPLNKHLGIFFRRKLPELLKKKNAAEAPASAKEDKPPAVEKEAKPAPEAKQRQAADKKPPGRKD